MEISVNVESIAEIVGHKIAKDNGAPEITKRLLTYTTIDSLKKFTAEEYEAVIALGILSYTELRKKGEAEVRSILDMR